MTLVCYTKTTKDKIQLQKKPFASGGEGSLHRIKSPAHWRGLVAKIYHRPKRTEKREEKIALLIKHPPEELQAGQWPTFVWPQDILQDHNGDFLGFVMPFVQGKKLELLCLPKLPKKLNGNWQRLAFGQKNSQDLRLRIAFNLSLAIYRIHHQDRYVLVDLKPENVLLQSNGQLALVDMDSVQVHEHSQLKFMAPVATPEYSAPEYYQIPKPTNFKSSWDSFALAVILYKLLLGIHPYAASAKAPNEQLVSLHQKIEAGLFVHHPEAKRLFKIIPPPHQKFTLLSNALQNLFMRSFVEGHSTPELRPLAEEWCWALLEELKDSKLKNHFQQMLQQQGLQVQRLRRPSELLPPLQEKERSWIDYLPNDYQLALSWKMPQLQYPPSGQKISLYVSMDSWVNFVASLLTTTAISIALISRVPGLYNWIIEELLNYPFWQLMLIVQGFFAFPIIIFPIIFWGISRSLSPNRRQWKSIKKKYVTQKQALQRWEEKLLKAQNKLRNLLSAEQPAYQEFSKQNKAIQLAYAKRLTALDEQFDQLLEQEKQKEALIIPPIIKQLKQSLPELKEATDFKTAYTILRKAEQEAVLLIQQEDIAKEYNQFKAMAQEEKRLAFERLEAEERRFLNYIEDQRELLVDRQRQDLQAQHNNLSRFNNLKRNYKQHLYLNARTELALVRKFNAAGFTSMSQIEKVNLPKALLHFKDGRTLKLSDFSTSDLTLAHRFLAWLNASKKEETLLQKELQHIEKFYAQERENLEQQALSEPKKFAERKANLQQQAENAFRQQKIQKIRKLYLEKRQKIRTTQQSFTKEMQVVLEERNPLYQTLEEEAKQLHKKHKEQLDKLKQQYQHKLCLQLQKENQYLQAWKAENLAEIEQELQKKAKLEQQLSAYKS